MPKLSLIRDPAAITWIVLRIEKTGNVKGDRLSREPRLADDECGRLSDIDDGAAGGRCRLRRNKVPSHSLSARRRILRAIYMIQAPLFDVAWVG